jgi:hypothetical protein
MEEEKVLTDQKHLYKWPLMEMLEAGKITLKEASEKIGMSYCAA